jgi:hypothetical protein
MEGDNKSWKEELEILEKVLGKKLAIEANDLHDPPKQKRDLLNT